MSINVIQLIQSALSDGVVRQIAGRLGLPPDTAQKVITTAGPALVAAFMQKGSTLEGARSLFATILSPEVNAHIGEQLPQLLGSTTGVSQLEGVGRHLLERALDRRVDGLSDEVAGQTGVPEHATHALTGIVGATLLGVLKRHFLEGQGNLGQLPTLLGHQLPSIAPYLNDRLMAALGLSGIGAFAGNILSQLKAVSGHVEHPVPAGPKPAVQTATSGVQSQSTVRVPPDAVMRAEPPSRKWAWWLLALLAALVAFLSLRGCHDGRNVAQVTAAPQPASAPVVASAVPAPAVSASDVAVSSAAASEAAQPAAAPAPTQDSQLTFTVDPAGKPTVDAKVGSEAEKAALIDALTKHFGTDRFTANITVDQDVRQADWLTHLDGLLPLMALPGAEVKVDGARIELSGTAANAKLNWLDKLKSLFGTSYQVGAFNVEQAVANATESFRGAIKGLLTPDNACATTDVVKALNLQVINFASASARVPASATDDLAQSAQVLNACVRNGKVAKLEVSGYSDNVGPTQANLQLSKKRAQAVRAFLIKAGVPADSLVAQGYGDVHPVSNNATASGRFANRRIEFVPMQ